MRVESSNLGVGMYVCELDRPWLNSPFLLQGFYIKEDEDIGTVRDLCEYVHVDKVIERGKLGNGLPGASSAILMSMKVSKEAGQEPRNRLSRGADESRPGQPQKSEQSIADFFPGKELKEYTDTVDWRAETRNARQAISYLYDYIGKFMALSSKSNRLDLQNIDKAVEPMLNSVIRNPHACLW